MIKIFILFLIFTFSLITHAQETGKGLTKLADAPNAPDFVLEDLDGEQFQLSEHRGQVVIINFWATWCPPCREEMPSMQRAWEQLEPEGIYLVGINVGEDEDTIFQFTADYPVEFPLLMDSDSSVINQWPVRGLPTTFVVDPKGQIVYRAIGGRDWNDPALLDFVKALKQ